MIATLEDQSCHSIFPDTYNCCKSSPMVNKDSDLLKIYLFEAKLRFANCLFTSHVDTTAKAELIHSLPCGLRAWESSTSWPKQGAGLGWSSQNLNWYHTDTGACSGRRNSVLSFSELVSHLYLWRGGLTSKAEGQRTREKGRERFLMQRFTA